MQAVAAQHHRELLKVPGARVVEAMLEQAIRMVVVEQATRMEEAIVEQATRVEEACVEQATRMEEVVQMPTPRAVAGRKGIGVKR